jgi:hypothetical protein
MQQAILITAYKNYHHLEEIFKVFGAEFGIYIHIDKKSNLSFEEMRVLTSYPQVKLVSQKYKVNWGGLNHLKSIIFLAEEALKSKETSYFHLISGHDYPIKPATEFVAFFKKNSDSEYMDHFKVPKLGWANNGGMDRIEYYNFYDLLNGKKPKQKGLIKRLIRIQKKLGFKRSISSKIPSLYGGSTWWSLSRACLDYVVTFTKNNKNVFNRFKHTLCSEEFYFSTIVMNSPFAEKVANTNLRYIDWVARNGNNPAILDNTDLDKLLNANSFFARKFEYPQSKELLTRLQNKLK